MDAEIHPLQRELVQRHNHTRQVFDYNDSVQIHPILIDSRSRIQQHESDPPSLPVESSQLDVAL
jgi:hypothetical protein